MTQLEKQYIEKLKEIIAEFELIHFATLSNTPRSHALVTKFKSEAFLLEQQIEQEEKTVENKICDLCGRKMVPKNREVIDYLCMNPECDNYIKLNK